MVIPPKLSNFLDGSTNHVTMPYVRVGLEQSLKIE
jgi:hypothetical protein